MKDELMHSPTETSTAEFLLENRDALFFARADYSAAQREFDDAARLQSQHCASLPLEGQLQYWEECLLKERQRAAASRQHAAALGFAPSEARDTAEVDASLAELNASGCERRIAELKENIAGRVRSSAHRITFPVRWEDHPGTLIIDAIGRYVFPKDINALAEIAAARKDDAAMTELIQPPLYRRVYLWLWARGWL
jgi:hypothetical protein